MATIRIKNDTEPDTPPSGYTEVWTDSSTKIAKAKDDAGVVTSLVSSVVGPVSSVDSRIAEFDGTTGKLLKDSGVTTSELFVAAGLAGGQTATGGTAASEDLTLESTSNATKGHVLVNDDTAFKGDIIIALDKDILIGDETTNAFGWNDIISEVTIKGSGAQDPSWANFRDGLYGYAFSASAIDEVQHRFHVLHDYAIGTKLYPHIHWSPNTTTATGTVRWGIEYTVAKGHQQVTGSTYGATTTVYVEQAITANSQYVHFVSELSDGDAIPSTNVEPDTMILIRMFRDATHVNDTFADAVFAWQTDIHYQSARFNTLNKAPDFYA